MYVLKFSDIIEYCSIVIFKSYFRLVKHNKFHMRTSFQGQASFCLPYSIASLAEARDKLRASSMIFHHLPHPYCFDYESRKV